MTETTATRHASRRSESAPWLIGSGAATLLAIVLSFLAFHDVHAGEADLTLEYTILIASAGWILLLAVALIWQGRLAFGVISLVALATIAWLARDAGPLAPASLARDLVATAVFVWFIVLSGTLLRTGFVALGEAGRPPVS